MAIRIFASGAQTLDRLMIGFWGDGTSTSVTVELTDAPFALPVRSNPPIAVRDTNAASVVVAGAVDPTFTIIPTFHHSAVVVQFNKPLPSGDDLNNAILDITLLYAGA